MSSNDDSAPPFRRSRRPFTIVISSGSSADDDEVSEVQSDRADDGADDGADDSADGADDGADGADDGADGADDGADDADDGIDDGADDNAAQEDGAASDDGFGQGFFDGMRLKIKNQRKVEEEMKEMSALTNRFTKMVPPWVLDEDWTEFHDKMKTYKRKKDEVVKANKMKEDEIEKGKEHLASWLNDFTKIATSYDSTMVSSLRDKLPADVLPTLIRLLILCYNGAEDIQDLDPAYKAMFKKDMKLALGTGVPPPSQNANALQIQIESLENRNTNLQKEGDDTSLKLQGLHQTLKDEKALHARTTKRYTEEITDCKRKLKNSSEWRVHWRTQAGEFEKKFNDELKDRNIDLRKIQGLQDTVIGKDAEIACITEKYNIQHNQILLRNTDDELIKQLNNSNVASLGETITSLKAQASQESERHTAALQSINDAAMKTERRLLQRVESVKKQENQADINKLAAVKEAKNLKFLNLQQEKREAELETTLEESQRQLKERNYAINDQRKEIRRLTEENEKQKTELYSNQFDAEASKSRIQILSGHVDEVKRTNAERVKLENDLKKATSKITRMTAEELKLKELEKSTETMFFQETQKNKELTNELEDKKRELGKLETKLDVVMNRLRRTEEQSDVTTRDYTKELGDVRTQLDNLRLDLKKSRDGNKSLTEKKNELQNDLEARSNECNRYMEEIQKLNTDCKATKNKGIQDAAEQIQRHKTEMRNQEIAQVNAMQELQSSLGKDYIKETSSLRTKLEDERKEYRDGKKAEQELTASLIRDYGKATNKIKADHGTEVEKLKKEHEKTTEKSKMDHGTEMEKLKKGHEKTTEKSEMEHGREIEKLKKEHEKTTEKSKMDYGTEMENLKKAYEKTTEELKIEHGTETEGVKARLEKEHEKITEKTKMEHGTEIEKFKKAHEKTIKELKTEHRTETEGLKARLQKEHEKTIEELKTEHGTETKGLKARLQKEHEKTIEELKTEHGTETEGLKARLQKEHETTKEIKMKHGTDTEGLKASLKKDYETQTQSLRVLLGDQHKLSTKTLKKEHGTEVGTLKESIEKERNAHASETDTHRRTSETLQNNRHASLQTFTASLCGISSTAPILDQLISWIYQNYDHEQGTIVDSSPWKILPTWEQAQTANPQVTGNSPFHLVGMLGGGSLSLLECQEALGSVISMAQSQTELQVQMWVNLMGLLVPWGLSFNRFEILLAIWQLLSIIQVRWREADERLQGYQNKVEEYLNAHAYSTIFTIISGKGGVESLVQSEGWREFADGLIVFSENAQGKEERQIVLVDTQKKTVRCFDRTLWGFSRWKVTVQIDGHEEVIQFRSFEDANWAIAQLV